MMFMFIEKLESDVILKEPTIAILNKELQIEETDDDLIGIWYT